jgi:hypothetical protein
MAVFESSYNVEILINETTKNILGTGSFEPADITATGNFTEGSIISVLFGTNTFNVAYVGFCDFGWIGKLGSDFYLFLNSAGPIPLPTPYDTGTLTVCFLAGTRIAAPGGEVAVEDVAVGDLVLTADGRTTAVRWIGVQTVASFFADPLRSFPICIAAGALGDGLPVRDLLVSPDHALFLDGVLVQAGALVNGTTITRVEAMPERFTYFHIELEDHALILAEGVPAETFVDNVTRRRFDNFAEFEALYGDGGATIAEMDVPRVKSSRQLPRSLRERLAGAACGGAITDAA